MPIFYWLEFRLLKTTLPATAEYPTLLLISFLLLSTPSFSRTTLLSGARIYIVIGIVFSVILAVLIGLLLSRRRKISRLRRADISVLLEYSKPKNTANIVRMK